MFYSIFLFNGHTSHLLGIICIAIFCSHSWENTYNTIFGRKKISLTLNSKQMDFDLHTCHSNISYGHQATPLPVGLSSALAHWLRFSTCKGTSSWRCDQHGSKEWFQEFHHTSKSWNSAQDFLHPKCQIQGHNHLVSQRTPCQKIHSGLFSLNIDNA